MELKNSKNDLTGNPDGLPDQEIWLSDLSLLDVKHYHYGWDVKASAIIVYLRQGAMSVVYEGEEMTVAAPAIFLVQPYHRIAIHSLSDDIKAPVISLSEEMTRNITEQIERYSNLKTSEFPFYVTVPERNIRHCDNLYDVLTHQLCNINKEHFAASSMYAILHFFFTVGYKFFEKRDEDASDCLASQISENFIYLVSLHHTKERFLDFYAKQLGITAKHLSKTVKRYTGMSAVEWIDMSLIIDSKMLLRTTDMTIKEIAEHLNFSSQSFFGKYFKKYVGVSPKEFRKG